LVRQVEKRQSLSPREREILLLVGEGLTSSEIAERLGVVPSTVDSIADGARRKLETGTRRQAASLLEGRRRRSRPPGARVLASLDPELVSLLELLGEGLTVEEISKRLSYSPRTIDRRLAAARKALRVETTAELLCAVSGLTPVHGP
jgi:DNA-binding NarL/FixJ family response regulator